MELPIVVGQVVAQKYRVDRFIGQGGMGVVVAGFHLELDQPVAIKFLISESGLQSEGAERFRREARAAAKIHSEHVARVFDIGLLDERVPYMVMELLHGNDLEFETERRGPLPVPEAVGYLLQAIDAVAEAHSVGIVHRDLKPTNLFLAQRADGSRIVKVLDFGISKSLSGRQREVALTRTAAFVGSPLFMSPEQMRSARDVDARADVWALGAILYVMVTGQLPHPGNSLPEVCLAVMNSSPRPLKDFIADPPEGLEAILLRCLMKDPTQRYGSVAELAEQLLPFAPEWHLVVERATRLLGGAPIAGSYPPSLIRSSNTPVISSVTPQRISAPLMNDQPSPPSATEAPWSKTGRKRSRRRRAPLLIAALFGLIGVLGVLLYATRRKAETPAIAAASPVVPSAALGPVVSDVHASMPASSAATTEAPVVADAMPSAAPAAPAPVAVPAKATERVAPRAIEPAAGGPHYTYFGGRR
ncbi:MAG TPA: serine/threonine-protein kinase [Polyangiaceae bacterium]|nr:serine/threonine-protein kinase [Polyangiaceae bacterium]